MHDAASQIVDDFLPSGSFIAAAKNSRHGALLSYPSIRTSFGAAKINHPFPVLGHGCAVVVALGSDLLPMIGAIETAECRFAAGGENCSWILLVSQHFMDIHVGQSFIGRPPVLSVV